jgi:16S rRNA (adenine1518-N6/adenine1519-N6)-dimethyltransferase
VSAQTRTEIKQLLEAHGLSPVHRLGQHFLADGNIIRKIVKLAKVGEGDNVLEVGAGTGTLTRALAGTGAHVVSYEIDTGLRPILEEVTRGLDVEIRFEDVTKVDFRELVSKGEWTLVANLPYNVGTPLIIDAVRSLPSIGLFVVMVQSEVANRFTASAGSSSYGVPSVVAALYTDAEVAFRVPPQVFVPPPNVESAVVVLTRKAVPELAEPAVDLARAAFGQRRKMLRRSLGSVVDDAAATLNSAGIDPTLRAEDLSADDYLKLAEFVK